MKKMNKKCLYCYDLLEQTNTSDFHERCSLKFFGTGTPPLYNYTIDQMTELARSVVQRSIAVPGVQPKLSLTIVRDTLERNSGGRLTIVGALGGNYIFKPPFAEYREMPQNEHVTMRIAEEAFGIRTVPSSLLRLQSGELAYITKRVDRKNDGSKIHMLDMFQILEAFNKYKSSMERVGKAIGMYSNSPLLDKTSYFEIAVFSYLTGNNDMHLKNFSMINSKENWILSPAYDLLNVAIVNPTDDEEMALTIEGKRKKLKLEHFIHLAEGLELNPKQINNVFDRFLKNKELAINWVDRSFLSDEFKNDYKTLLDKRYTIFDKG